MKRPYQIESWSLGFTEVRDMVADIWAMFIVGSSAYVLSRRLQLLRKRLKAWCLDRKLFWGINWKQLLDKLQNSANNILTIQDGVQFTQQHRTLAHETQLAYAYWRQRQRNHFLQCGDLPSKLLFRRLKKKNQPHAIHMLQRPDGEWMTNPQDIEVLITQHFTNIFNPYADSATVPPTPEMIDLVFEFATVE